MNKKCIQKDYPMMPLVPPNKIIFYHFIQPFRNFFPSLNVSTNVSSKGVINALVDNFCILSKGQKIIFRSYKGAWNGSPISPLETNYTKKPGFGVGGGGGRGIRNLGKNSPIRGRGLNVLSPQGGTSSEKRTIELIFQHLLSYFLAQYFTRTQSRLNCLKSLA